jgi:Phytoene dehydrogenase and related proteins
MGTSNRDNSIIIIGAGFAGLSAGIYAQMNGYKTQIFEMNDKPGGLCTSWKRNGFIIDGCIHWLVGSSPESAMHDFWKEVGLIQGREFVYSDEYMRYEGQGGRKIIFYCDVNHLEKHLLDFSPLDKEPILEFISGIRMALNFDQPSAGTPLLKRLAKTARLFYTFVTKGKTLKRWMKTTSQEFSARFSDPMLKDAFNELWLPDFSMLFMLFMFAYLHKKDAGYPIGGSMPMSRALEARYNELGGIINYDKKVEKILTEGNKAAGIRLSDGTEFRASRVVSAADGYNTIYKMLDDKYADEKIHEPYEKWPVFPSLIFAGFGVNCTFDDEPVTVSGFSYQLEKPAIIADAAIERLSVHIYNQDKSLSPAGKSVMTIMLPSDYSYWKKLAEDKEAYNRKKDEIGKQLVELLGQRFPDISSKVEMMNIATPMTFERYTGNWKGCFEGWLITPLNANVKMKPMSQTLPGLNDFYMCGQWVEPGGGLPTGVMSGRRLIKKICKEDDRKFMTSYK